jgi:hypothetical protein
MDPLLCPSDYVHTSLIPQEKGLVSVLQMRKEFQGGEGMSP